MNENELLERIGVTPGIMAGKPVIRGTRLTVEYILNLLARGSTFEQVLEEYDGLTLEDIRACLLFAMRSSQSTDFMPLGSEAT